MIYCYHYLMHLMLSGNSSHYHYGKMIEIEAEELKNKIARAHVE